jgi:hypothetical protein
MAFILFDDEYMVMMAVAFALLLAPFASDWRRNRG